MSLNEELKKYIENNVFPQYKKMKMDTKLIILNMLLVDVLNCAKIWT